MDPRLIFTSTMRYQTLSYLFFEELSLTQEIRSKTQTNLLDTSIIRFD